MADFAEDRAQDFAGRPDVLDGLAKFVSSSPGDGPWALSITGPVGAGKSALWSLLHARLMQVKSALVLSHVAGTNQRVSSVDAMLRRWIDELSSDLGLMTMLEDSAKEDHVEAVFASLLGQAAQKHRVLLLIDGLERFEQTTRALHMTWLPELWPGNARLIVTAIPGEASRSLQQRPGVETLQLPPLVTPATRSVVDANRGTPNDSTTNLGRAVHANDHRQTQFDIAVGNIKAGDARMKAGNLTAALDLYGHAIAVIAHLVEADPEQADWQNELAISHAKIGEILRGRGDLAGALNAHYAGLSVFLRSARAALKNPDVLRNLATCHQQIGDLQAIQADTSGALRSYRESLAILKAGLETSNGAVSADWQHDTAMTHVRIYEISVKQNRQAEALHAARAALQILDNMLAHGVRLDPTLLTTRALIRKWATENADNASERPFTSLNPFLWGQRPKVLVVRISVFIVVLALLGTGWWFFSTRTEYNPPNAEQIRKADEAIAEIDTIEPTLETHYFDPSLHTTLSLDYAYAFVGHTDNTDYFERMISELIVSFNIRKDLGVKSLLKQLYTAYHSHNSPKNIYMPADVSFDKWLEFAEILSPHPDLVRIVIDAETDLDAAYQRYTLSHPSDADVQMSYEATKNHIHTMFLIATARTIIRTPSGGQLFFTPSLYEEWDKAIHSLGYATRNTFDVQQVFDASFPADAVLLLGGEDKGCYHIAPDFIIVPGVKYFARLADS